MKSDQFEGTRHHLRVLLIILVACGAFVVQLAAPVRASAATASTVVSLTFDDGRATVYNARSILAAHGMHGTFYVNSAELGSSSFYLTRAQLHDLYSDGNEVGGHDAMHANLVQVDDNEAQRQICYDRNNLLALGYPVTSFAYPYGAYNASSKSFASSCGYNSARTTDNLTTSAVAIPPADPYAIPIGTGSLDLAALKAAVSQAVANGGGWVPLMFHDICAACSSVSISPTDFSSLLDWLKAQESSGVVVKTVHEVIGGSVKAGVAGPSLPAAPQGASTLRNSSLEYSTDGYTPDCFAADGFGSNNFSWARTTDAHTGNQAQKVDITSYTSGAAELIIREDLGACTPTVLSGHTYRVSTWYKSTSPVSFVAEKRSTDYGFSYWTSSPQFPAASSWTLATWETPAVPDGVNGMSFGLSLDSKGSLTVDDISMVDAAGGSADTTAPTVTLSSPEAGETVAGTVWISASATDDSAVDHVDFIVDGTRVGSAVAGRLGYDWNTRNVSNGTHQITARAVDTSGNAAVSSARSVFVSNQTTNLIQNPSLESAASPTSVPTCWMLGGYGTNTYTWTRSTDAHSGSYSQALQISAWSVGDRKLVSTQDSGTCAPAAVPGHRYTISAWYKGTLPSYLYSYYRNAAGNWVYLSQSTRLPAASTWTQASWPTPALPAGATNISIGIGGSSTGLLQMDDFALIDNTPVPDTTAPTSTISCDGLTSEESCGGYFNHTVGVKLSATDDASGSGVASIVYTTDGTEPTSTNGTTYTGPFNTVTAVKWRAFDNAGNAEAVRTQAIHVDTVAPTSTAKCDGSDCGTTTGAVSITLSASDDSGGSGVAGIVYTTDGTDPTISSGQAYVGAFSVSTDTEIRFRAFDNAGNVENAHVLNLTVDTSAPTSAIKCNGDACSSNYYGADVVVTLSAAEAAGGSGVAAIRYTTDGSEPTQSNGSTYTQPFTVDSTVTINYRAIDHVGNQESVNTFVLKIDKSSPTSTITCNGETCTNAQYASPVSVTLTADDGQNGSGIAAIRFTTDGSEPTKTDGRVYSEPFNVANSATIKFRAIDKAGNAEDVKAVALDIAPSGDTGKPTTTVLCNGAACSGDFYPSSVDLTVSATDGDGTGVSLIRYTTDGSEPTLDNGHDYATPIALAKTTTVKTRAYDAAQNVGPVLTTIVRIDTEAPSVLAECGSASCSSDYYRQAQSISLTADDGSGSGVAAIRYTTDGSDPSPTNGVAYSSPFSVTSTSTIKYFATDVAGNISATSTVTVKIDTVSPKSTLTCNGSACASSFYTSHVSAVLDASDSAEGSGVSEIRYTLDGSDPTKTNGKAFTDPIDLASSVTLKYRAYDKAGNAEPVNSAVLSIDTTAPVTDMSCDGAKCSDGWYKAAVTAVLTASDADSGVASTRYTTDGSTPSTTNGTLYSDSFRITATSVIKFRSFDKVGNAGSVSTVVVQVDLTAPTVNLTTPAAQSFLSGSVDLAATAADANGVDHVDFKVDGTRVTSDSTAPYGYAWDSTSVADGSHVITAVAVDTAGNTTTSNPVTVTTGNTNLVSNPSFETGTTTTPTCWILGGYGTNAYSWERATDAHSGSYGEKLTVTSYSAGDRKLVIAQDAGTCAPSVSAGQSYAISGWYKSTSRPLLFLYYRTSSGWVYWTTQRLSTAASWTQFTYTLPALPAGATHISFGLGSDAVGVLTMDDLALYRLL